MQDFINDTEESRRIQLAEEYFDAIFDNIYEDRIIETVFDNNAIIPYDTFISKICPKKSFKSTTTSLFEIKQKNLNQKNKKKLVPMPDEPPFLDINCDKNMVWLFSPMHLRKVFFEDLHDHFVNQQKALEMDEWMNKLPTYQYIQLITKPVDTQIESSPAHLTSY